MNAEARQDVAAWPCIIAEHRDLAAQLAAALARVQTLERELEAAVAAIPPKNAETQELSDRKLLLDLLSYVPGWSVMRMSAVDRILNEQTALRIERDEARERAESALARVQTLERALAEWKEARDSLNAYRAAQPIVEKRRLSIAEQTNELDLIRAEFEMRESLAALALRAVVLEGAAGNALVEPKEKDSGGDDEA